MVQVRQSTRFTAILSVAGLMIGSAAAPALAAPRGLDPLVAVSALSTSSSRAAVCAAGAGASGAAVAATSNAAQAAPARQGCVLPIVDAPPPPIVPVTSGAAAPAGAPVFAAPIAGSAIAGLVPVLAGLAALTVLLTQIKGKGGDLPDTVVPVSPA